MAKTLDALTNEEFDQLVEQHIDQAAEWDGALPLDTILATWAMNMKMLSATTETKSISLNSEVKDET